MSPLCTWCTNPIPAAARRDSKHCSKRCRQAAFRLRVLADRVERVGGPLRLAYADPPYPGMADYYADQPTYGGEVDHVELVARLSDGRYDGWALSTSAEALRFVLPLCPAEARVCAWGKPIGVPEATRGLHNTWEPLIVMPARRLRPGKRDWLQAMPARGGGSTLIGRKPLAFCAWLFGLLGALPGDSLDDLYPGSGVVGNAWREVSRVAGADVSLLQEHDASTGHARDASPRPGCDVSLVDAADASCAGVGDVSLAAVGDASPKYCDDASRSAAGDASLIAASDAWRRGLAVSRACAADALDGGLRHGEKSWIESR